jgi:hypothetical protein
MYSIFMLYCLSVRVNGDDLMRCDVMMYGLILLDIRLFVNHIWCVFGFLVMFYCVSIFHNISYFSLIFSEFFEVFYYYEGYLAPWLPNHGREVHPGGKNPLSELKCHLKSPWWITTLSFFVPLLPK